MNIRIGLMGFGRIGRNIFRILHGRKDMGVVAISDVADHEGLRYLLRFDTVLGRFPDPVELQGGDLLVGGRSVKMLSGRAPGEVDWGALGVDVVIEATGRHRSRAELQKHLQAGARHVVLCVPPQEGEDPDATIICGVNEGSLSPMHRIVSNGSCTANAVGPVLKTLHEAFGVRMAFLTIVHAYTNDQRLADVPAEDLRRSRAAAENIIPTETRACAMLMSLIPELRGRLGGLAMNVPVPDGSVVDAVIQFDRPAGVAGVNDAMRRACTSGLSGLIEFEDDPIVSSDVIINPHSGIFDSLATQALGEDLVRVLVWFDNGWGYAHRALELARRLAGMPAASGQEVAR